MNDEINLDDESELGELPVMKKDALRRAAFIGVLRTALIAVVLIGVLNVAWTRLVAPAVATRDDRDVLIEQQISGSLQSLYPSSEVGPPKRTIGRDGSLQFHFFITDSGSGRQQRMFEYEVSAAGAVDVDLDAFSLAVSTSETLRYRDTEPSPAAELTGSAAMLPAAAVVSFAVQLPAPLNDNDAKALWKDLETLGVAPSGYLLAPDRAGNPRAWTGSDLSEYRAWDHSMQQTNGVALSSSAVGVIGPDAGNAPKTAVTGLVFTELPAGRIEAVIDRTGAPTVTPGPVGLSLNELPRPPK